MPKSAIIIGGSLSGLMAGIMLKHHGHHVTILERSAHARSGYDAGIKVGPELTDFLAQHDDVNYPMVITCLPGVRINADGRPGAARGQTLVNTSWGLFSGILRANFDGEVCAAVPVAPQKRERDGTAKYVGGARVVDVRESESGDGVRVWYEDVEGKVGEPLTADMVVIADGSTSTTREIFLPEVKREYCGYMCWRGTVAEECVDDEWNKLYAEKTTFHIMGSGNEYLLNYTIPTDSGDLTPGKRLHNWIWYTNATPTSPLLTDTFTDIHGTHHRGTISRGLIQPSLWSQKQHLATTHLPPGLAAIVRSSPHPFASKIHSVDSPRATFLNGKVFLIGDAQTTLRPNTGMGTTHAAHDVNVLEEVVKGRITAREWERRVLRWNRRQRAFAGLVSCYLLGSWWGVVGWGLLWGALGVGMSMGLI